METGLFGNLTSKNLKDSNSWLTLCPRPRCYGTRRTQSAPPLMATEFMPATAVGVSSGPLLSISSTMSGKQTFQPNIEFKGLAWSKMPAGPRMPSPVSVGGYLYVTGRGTFKGELDGGQISGGSLLSKNGAPYIALNGNPIQNIGMLAGSIEIGSNVSVIYQVRSTAQSPFCFWTIS